MAASRVGERLAAGPRRGLGCADLIAAEAVGHRGGLRDLVGALGDEPAVVVARAADALKKVLQREPRGCDRGFSPRHDIARPGLGCMGWGRWTDRGSGGRHWRAGWESSARIAFRDQGELTLQVIGIVGRLWTAEMFVQVVELVVKKVDFAGKGLDFGFGAAVDFEVEFGAQAVAGVLAVLAHHDDRGLDGGEHREKEIEQNEGVRVPGAPFEQDVDGGIDGQDNGEGDDEGPRAAKGCDAVGDAFAEGFALVDELVGVAGGTACDESLGGVDFAGDDGEEIKAGHGLALEELGEIVTVDLDAGGRVHGDG